MNYEEEQSMEIEALQSIYPDEFQILSDENPKRFEITVHSEPNDDGEPEISIKLFFTYTPQYPETAPKFDVEIEEGLEDDEDKKIKALLQEQAEANLGMVMIYTLTTAVKEWMDNYLEQERQAVRKAEDEEKSRQQEAAFKASGTPVTKENFLLWKLKFDRELEEIKQKNAALRAAEEKKRKPTGRQLFEQDESLKNSDMSALDEGDVPIDESVFEGLDDLDDQLNDEDEVARPSFLSDDEDD